MKTQIRSFPYDKGEIQRIQVARLDSWEQLALLKPTPSPEALDCFARIYRLYLVPAAPWLFGNLVLFRLPEGFALPRSLTDACGHIADPLTVAARELQKGLRFQKETPRFRSAEAEALWQALTDRDCVRVVRGKLPITTVIPVGNRAGFLTETRPQARLKVNSHFFIMDPFDCGTVHDHVGEPFGLFVRDGIVEQPPLYRREALLVRSDGSVSVEPRDIRELTVRIGDTAFVHGKNARIFTRPSAVFTPPGKQALVIVGRTVAAVCNGSTAVPCSGFVLCPDSSVEVQPGARVTYEGMEDIRFGIQVGNSILRGGVKTDRFYSKFYKIRRLQPIPYPPSLYPMHFSRDRAARIALGADSEGRPMLLWAEGAAKLGHTPGVDSPGASLSDMAELCDAVGMKHAVNLDGGGSAQLLIDGKRSLFLSDRRQEDFSETERPVPLGLML